MTPYVDVRSWRLVYVLLVTKDLRNILFNNVRPFLRKPQIISPISMECTHYIQSNNFDFVSHCIDRLCGLVVRVPSHRSKGPGSIPGTARFSEK
jgi:hypothetical protein